LAWTGAHAANLTLVSLVPPFGQQQGRAEQHRARLADRLLPRVCDPGAGVGAVADGPGWERLPHGGQQEVLVIAREQAVAVFAVFVLVVAVDGAWIGEAEPGRQFRPEVFGQVLPAVTGLRVRGPFGDLGGHLLLQLGQGVRGEEEPVIAHGRTIHAPLLEWHLLHIT
jgi:hypothetical protein